ncbi:cytochrome c biogenesis CcdA family protein [Streptomyces luomodiensis]|uniref:Cytochrome c biogenesis CcdA family protein n=1 Tax=Streptomyces luomodiensis TaxID=3026192 RepID=A0ABY9V623_9ACTN|nr:cytochrome c biogenesis CcdA family protein [Streptomyces sp. SCA4-21]WNF00308.1 cytochrome c biogenesis CcdA family protein [Streptomyces sp. SCA4-21]
MTRDASLLAAFLGGLLALLSPCSALLLPAFFAYSFTTTTRLLLRTVLFYLGLCTTLVPLGVAGSFASRLFYSHRELLVTVGGWTVIALGAAQVLGLGFGVRRLQEAAGARRSGSAVSVFVLGTVYGLAGFCAGPILGSILTLAALGGRPAHGGLLLAVYALGMAVPLFALSLLWDRFDLGRKRWLRGRTLRLGPLSWHTTSLAGGTLFILLGVVFLVFDGTAALPSPVSVETEAGLEEHLAHIGSAVPDRILLLVLAAAAALTAVVLLVRREAPRAKPRPEEPSRHGS